MLRERVVRGGQRKIDFGILYCVSAYGGLGCRWVNRFNIKGGGVDGLRV